MSTRRILGLNVGSNASMPNGRGWVDPSNAAFRYLPIVEEAELIRSAPTYRDLGFSDLNAPDLPVHLDPEFETYTYGHRKRFGDTALWRLKSGDVLFFYATLDVLPERLHWGVFAIGYFVVDYVLDAQPLSDARVRGLVAFKRNAHLLRREPGVDLLVRGSSASRLYTKAFRLSKKGQPGQLRPELQGRFETATGKPVIGGSGWWRWLLFSEDQELIDHLLKHA